MARENLRVDVATAEAVLRIVLGAAPGREGEQLAPPEVQTGQPRTAYLQRFGGQLHSPGLSDPHKSFPRHTSVDGRIQIDKRSPSAQGKVASARPATLISLSFYR